MLLQRRRRPRRPCPRRRGISLTIYISITFLRPRLRPSLIPLVRFSHHLIAIYQPSTNNNIQ